MFGYKIRGLGGKALRGPDGYAVRRGGCLQIDTCGLCSGPTPAGFQVAVSAVDFCPIGQCNGSGIRILSHTGDLNGSAQLCQIGSAALPGGECLFYGRDFLGVSITAEQWSNPDCTGAMQIIVYDKPAMKTQIGPGGVRNILYGLFDEWPELQIPALDPFLVFPDILFAFGTEIIRCDGSWGGSNTLSCSTKFAEGGNVSVSAIS